MGQAIKRANDVVQIETVYQLVLQDYGNLSTQVLDEAAQGAGLRGLAERMNYALGQAGVRSIEAEVHAVEREVYRWQVDPDFL